MTVSNVEQLPCVPETDTMHEVVRRLFSRAEHGLVEISSTDARAPHKLNAGQLFDINDLDAAVAYAARVNQTPNRNVYVSAGIRRPGTYINARASDADVDKCAALWADFDAPGALASALQILEAIDLTPNLITFTGNEPHLRGQVWWVLEEPTADLELHMRLERALAIKLGGDPSIVNPSRVMRLAGSVAWPLKAGRALEMTGVYDAVIRNPNYSIEEIHATLERVGALEKPKPTATLLDFNSAEPTHDLSSLIAGAAKPGEWHRHALLAVAHLLGRGTPGDVVVDMLTPMLQQPGFTHLETRAQVVTMTEGGISRGFLRHSAVQPAEQFRPEIQIPQAAPAPRENPFFSVDDLLDLPPMEWMIEGYLPDKGMSALFAPPGAFKSFLALDMAMSVAYGLPWHGLATRQRKTLYVVSEGRHGFGRRAGVWRQHRAGGAATDQFALLPVPVNFLDPGCVDNLLAAIADHLGEVGFVVLDTLARNFGSGDENSTKDMNAYVAGTTRLAERGAGAHVLHVHHTGKDGEKGERGSSAFLGALDTSLKLAREPKSDVAMLYVKKQKDGPEAGAMRLVFPVAEGSHPRTGEVFESRVPTLAGEASHPAEEAVKGGSGVSKTQLKILELVTSGMSSLTLLAAELGADKSNVARALKRLSERNLVRQDENHFWHPVVISNDQINQEVDHENDH